MANSTKDATTQASEPTRKSMAKKCKFCLRSYTDQAVTVCEGCGAVLPPEEIQEEASRAQEMEKQLQIPEEQLEMKPKKLITKKVAFYQGACFMGMIGALEGPIESCLLFVCMIAAGWVYIARKKAIMSGKHNFLTVMSIKNLCWLTFCLWGMTWDAAGQQYYGVYTSLILFAIGISFPLRRMRR